MKKRTGFVSNSSSSSFVLGKNCLNEEQIRELSKTISEINNKGSCDTYIHQSKKYFHGEIDNCDTEKLTNKLEELKVLKDDYEFNC